MYELFLKQLKKHEGEKLTAYKDTVGILTVGVGHNCVSSPVPGVEKVGDKITQEMSDKLFREDVEIHVSELKDMLPWVTKLDDARQAVLYNMVFNLGIKGLLGFKNTLNMIKDGNYKQASEAMLVSKWASQVKYRAKELASQMATGDWVGV